MANEKSEGRATAGSVPWSAFAEQNSPLYISTRRRIVPCLPRVWNKRPCLDNAGLNSYKGNIFPHSLVVCLLCRPSLLLLNYRWFSLEQYSEDPWKGATQRKRERGGEREREIEKKGNRDSTVATKSEMITHKRFWGREEGLQAEVNLIVHILLSLDSTDLSHTRLSSAAFMCIFLSYTLPWIVLRILDSLERDYCDLVRWSLQVILILVEVVPRS